MRRLAALAFAFALVLVSAPLAAQSPDSARARECPSCAEWNAPQEPFRLFGNVYFVGTHGLSALLVTSPQGHVLLDGGLPESAAPILAHVRALGFRAEDVKLILNSHAHFDHAGGIEALRRATGATVAATAWSARTIERGASGPDDPQYGVLLPYPAVPNVRVIADGDTVRVGAGDGGLALVAHLTAGHTPGGTTWTWRSCERDAAGAARCLDFVYADSQTPVSADGFLYTRSTTYPTGVRDFERGQATLESLSCDVLVTPHPGASGLWERVEKHALVDREACRRYAATARQALARRVATEQAAK